MSFRERSPLAFPSCRQCAIFALALSSAPNAQAAPQPAAASATTPETKSTEAVARIRQIAVEIERETAPREVERRKFNELKTFIDGRGDGAVRAGRTAKRRHCRPTHRLCHRAHPILSRMVWSSVSAAPMPNRFEFGGARTARQWRCRRRLVRKVQGRPSRRARLAASCERPGQVMVDVLVDGASVAVGARDQAAAELTSNGGSIPRLTASMRNRLRFK